MAPISGIVPTLTVSVLIDGTSGTVPGVGSSILAAGWGAEQWARPAAWSGAWWCRRPESY